MLKRTITGFVLLGIAFLVLYLSSFSHFIFDAFVMLVAMLALYEMYQAMKKIDIHPSGIAFIVLGICIYPLSYFFGYIGLFYSFIIAFLTGFIVYIFDFRKKLNDFIMSIFLFVYPTILLGLAFVLNKQYGLIPVLFAISSALMSDTIAYYGGSLWGKKKIFPKISPKKTYTGSIMGLFGGAIGGLLIYLLFEVAKYPANIVFKFSDVSKYPYLLYIFIGILMAVGSQLGDLAASRIKREVGIKDYGTLLGSHGGIVDRFDSVLFSIAIMSMIMYFVF